jgi:hypothetical protein
MHFYTKATSFMMRNGAEGDKLYAQDLLHTVLVPSNVLGIEEFAERAGLWRINQGPWMTRPSFEALIDAEPQ